MQNVPANYLHGGEKVELRHLWRGQMPSWLQICDHCNQDMNTPDCQSHLGHLWQLEQRNQQQMEQGSNVFGFGNIHNNG
jgi:hypothetical protein